MPPKKKKNNKKDDDWIEPAGFNKGEDGEDLGGLMSAITTLKKKKNVEITNLDEDFEDSKPVKKGKKKKNRDFDDEEDAAEILAKLDAEEEAEPVPVKKGKAKKGKKAFDDEEDAAAILAQLDAEEEAEPAPAPAKKSKGKKNKKDFDDEEDAAAILARLDAEEQEEEKPVKKEKPAKKEKEITEEDIPDPSTIRIKTKAEKEREKKERAKLAKKKAAPQKKQETAAPAPVVEETFVVDEVVSSGKKDKKGGKKPAGAIAALRNALAAKKAAEEEAARLVEEERQRVLAEEAKAAEEERLKEEARQKKKEKERLKKEELKKSGKYLTPAQKLAQQQAKAKLDALLASGQVVVKALAEGEEEKKPKRPIYSNRKKKNNQKEKVVDSKPASEKAVSEQGEPKEPWDAESDEEKATPTTEKEPEVKEAWDAESDSNVKDSWDAESDSNVKDSWDADSDDNVKDSWDAESEDEKPKVVEKPKQTKVVKEEPKQTKIVKEEPKQAKIVKEEPKQQKVTKEAPKVEQKVTKEAAKSPVASKEQQEESEEEDSEEESDDDSEEDSEDESEDEDGYTATERQAMKRKEEAHKRREERIAASMAARSKDNLRSPICVIMGHVDTGKTKLLDKIRQTNVQGGEAGGITQQIGATYFPISAVEEKTALIHEGKPSGYKLPGLLVIDTPGHESFSNLRSRGSSLCNIAVLVVDIVHGLEPQTLESLNMLRARKTPFVVALNKIDRLFDWETHKDFPTRKTLELQKKHVLKEFNERVTKTIVEFAEQGLNACLYWENTNMGRNVSLIPTSAVTGEGVPDLLHLLMDLCQNRMTESLMYISELECTVLEVKVIEGLGTTIDVILSNGVLNEGDKICVCGLNGPIVTQVRALLTPQPMRELRVKSEYQHHKSVKASLGVKIAAPDLEKAIAGSRLLVIGPDDDEDDIREEVMTDLQTLLTSIDKSGKGVCVQASTLGSLEALLSFLKDSKIPVSGINIGPVHKKDIIRASVMLERCPEYAQMLAFDVPIDKDAEQLANEMGVKIFSANIIYHLFDKFTAYMKELEEQRKVDAAPSAVFPCLLKMVPDAIFNKRAPIIIGVDVMEGVLKIGTPLCVVNKDNGNIISLGKVVGIELNKKPKQVVKRGDPSVAIRVECATYQTPAMYGRHFTQDNEIYSHITRQSIDVLKNTFRDEVSKDDWKLVVRLKKILSIQ
ncbi:hypothetical protein HDV04_001655 [Boothiomyces sp. JEL0838]|nr:hypothetical protein HDV04_001655 [Boothiomyces sp. JEL0838]